MAHSTNVKWLTGANIQFYLDKFAEEFYRWYQGQVHLSINIFGGSALLLKHPEFRAGTVDIDSFLRAVPDIPLKPFIEEFARAYNVPYDWMRIYVRVPLSVFDYFKERLCIRFFITALSCVLFLMLTSCV